MIKHNHMQKGKQVSVKISQPLLNVLGQIEQNIGKNTSQSIVYALECLAMEMGIDYSKGVCHD